MSTTAVPGVQGSTPRDVVCPLLPVTRGVSSSPPGPPRPRGHESHRQRPRLPRSHSVPAAPVSVRTLQPFIYKEKQFTESPLEAFSGGLNVASSPRGLGTSSQISVDLTYEGSDLFFFFFLILPAFSKLISKAHFMAWFIKSSIFPSNNISLKHEDFLH